MLNAPKSVRRRTEWKRMSYQPVERGRKEKAKENTLEGAPHRKDTLAPLPTGAIQAGVSQNIFTNTRRRRSTGLSSSAHRQSQGADAPALSVFARNSLFNDNIARASGGITSYCISVGDALVFVCCVLGGADPLVRTSHKR
jgi:hypothetical protein